MQFIRTVIKENIKENKANNLNQRGRRLFQQGKFREALRVFDEALVLYEQLDPDQTRLARAMVLDNKGRALARLGRRSAALKAHDQAIALMPDFMLPWNNKGLLLLSQGQYAAALRCFDEATRITPTREPILWVSRGEVLEKLGRYEEAARSFDEAIGLRSSTARAWFGLARCALVQDDTDYALKCLETCIKVDRENYHARLLEAETRISLNVDDQTAWYRKGAAHYWLGSYDQALEALDRAIELDPGHDAAFQARGDVLLRMGKARRALADFEEACRLNPKNMWARKGIQEAKEMLSQ